MTNYEYIKQNEKYLTFDELMLLMETSENEVLRSVYRIIKQSEEENE